MHPTTTALFAFATAAINVSSSSASSSHGGGVHADPTLMSSVMTFTNQLRQAQELLDSTRPSSFSPPVTKTDDNLKTSKNGSAGGRGLRGLETLEDIEVAIDEQLDECQLCQQSLERYESDREIGNYMLVQIARKCEVSYDDETERYRFTTHTISPVSWSFQNRPTGFEIESSTESYFAHYALAKNDTTLAESIEENPANAAFTFVSRGTDDGRLIGQFVAQIKGGDVDYTHMVELEGGGNQTVPLFSYEIQQTESQEYVLPLSSYLDDDTKSATFEDCSVFIQ